MGLPSTPLQQRGRPVPQGHHVPEGHPVPKGCPCLKGISVPKGQPVLHRGLVPKGHPVLEGGILSPRDVLSWTGVLSPRDILSPRVILPWMGVLPLKGFLSPQNILSPWGVLAPRMSCPRWGSWLRSPTPRDVFHPAHTMAQLGTHEPPRHPSLPQGTAAHPALPPTMPSLQPLLPTGRSSGGSSRRTYNNALLQEKGVSGRSGEPRRGGWQPFPKSGCYFVVVERK